MARLLFDSVTPAAIPPGAQMVGGYVNGAYTWSSADWNRFPGAEQVRINVTGDPSLGNALDVETGDATPGQAPRWYDARHAAGIRNLAVYCNRATLPAVNAAMGARPFYRWIATLDGTMRPGGNADAVQFAGAAAAGIAADISVVWTGSWHGPPAAPKLTSWATDGKTSLVAEARAHGTAPSSILRHTAIAGGEFSAALAAYLNGIFGGTISPAEPMPAGITLRRRT